MGTTIKIGVSFSETKYPNFPAWILGGNEVVEVVELFWDQQNREDLDRCDGLLLTGGVDIDPFFFAPEVTNYPNQPESWNRIRDQFEIDLFKRALSLKMPVLGICRGLQLINVALGGSLIADLEASGRNNHRNMGGIDFIHRVNLENSTLLKRICDVEGGLANSAHHQAIGQVAEALQVNCYSADGIIEGIELKDQRDCSPLIAIQWHPERIENKEINPLSQNIRGWFLEQAIKFKL